MKKQLTKSILNKFKKNNFSLIPNFPKKNILIEVTNFCNNKCIFCYNRKMQRERKMIDFDFALKILQDIYNCGGKEVGFYATGEPLLYPLLDKLILKASHIGYEYIYLTTNGILASKETVEHLIKQGLNSIKFSINSINKDDYKFIHGNNCFEQVIQNLTDCFSLKSKYKFKLFVSYIATKYTNKSKDSIESFFQDKCDDIIIQSAQNQGGLLKTAIDLLSFKDCDNGYVNNRFKAPCFYVFNSLTITCDQKLTACCMDFENYLAYADLTKESLIESWTKNTIENLRRQHLEQKISNNLCSYCIGCNYKTVKPLDSSLTCNINVNKLKSDIQAQKRINLFLDKN